jgi:hypothetical protein
MFEIPEASRRPPLQFFDPPANPQHMPRPTRATSLVFENSQFGRPIGQRQHQSLDIGIAGEQFRLDARDLAEALFDSCGLLAPLQRDLVKRAAVAIQSGRTASVFLPALNDAVRVLGIELHEPGFAVPPLAGDQC